MTLCKEIGISEIKIYQQDYGGLGWVFFVFFLKLDKMALQLVPHGVSKEKIMLAAVAGKENQNFMTDLPQCYLPPSGFYIC